jgi:hypothetical protein
MRLSHLRILHYDEEVETAVREQAANARLGFLSRWNH